MSATFERIFAELVPQSGKCDTVAGEMLRAAGRLRHDFYNNGMGNNTSGALKFLREKSAIDRELFDYVLPYTTGRLYQGKYENDLFHIAIDRIVEMTTKMVTFNPQLMAMENTEDMFDYSDEDLDETCWVTGMTITESVRVTGMTITETKTVTSVTVLVWLENNA